MMMKSAKLIALSLIIAIVEVGCEERDFGELVCVGDLKAIDNDLRKGHDPDQLVKGQLPLNIAVSSHCRAKIDMVELLLGNGANVNGKDQSGLSPIMAASRDGNWEAVKLFIDRGGDVNATDERGYTAPMRLSISNLARMKPIYDMFAEAGADLGKQAPDGTTAKTWVIGAGAPELAAYIDKLIATKKHQR